MKSSKKGELSWVELLFLVILGGLLFYYLPKYIHRNEAEYAPSEKISHGIREGNVQSARPDRWEAQKATETTDSF